MAFLVASPLGARGSLDHPSMKHGTATLNIVAQTELLTFTAFLLK
jgi:hypothetical protein